MLLLPSYPLVSSLSPRSVSSLSLLLSLLSQHLSAVAVVVGYHLYVYRAASFGGGAFGVGRRCRWVCVGVSCCIANGTRKGRTYVIWFRLEDTPPPSSLVYHAQTN